VHRFSSTLRLGAGEPAREGVFHAQRGEFENQFVVFEQESGAAGARRS
jgi:hypothetical protein